jgi:hypothetical protein
MSSLDSWLALDFGTTTLLDFTIFLEVVGEDFLESVPFLEVILTSFFGMIL